MKICKFSIIISNMSTHMRKMALFVRPAVHQQLILILTLRLLLTTTTVITFSNHRLPGEPQQHGCMEDSDQNLRAETLTTSS